jgi:membrane associated rhomboid family serine protease
MILLPIGHEEEGVRRLPWVTFGVMILCLLAFFMTGRQALFPEDDVEAGEEAMQALEYFVEHPYLELDSDFRKRFLPAEGTDEEFDAYISAIGTMAGSPPQSAAVRASEQEVLDGFTQKALESFDAHPLMRWGLVPNDISLVGLLTHMFLHAGWLHLVGNMLILYLAGPFIEDVWGRPLYLGFYLVAGIVAAFFHIGFNAGSSVPMIGASGAIAGVMGAFLIRYRTTRIRFFYMFGLLFRGTFTAPAWIMLPLWFGQQLFLAMLTKNMGDGAGVAYWAHVGGFAFGLGAAGLIVAMRIEERYLHAAIEGKVHSTVVSNQIVDRALEAQHAGQSERAFEMLFAEARKAPANYDAALAFWGVAVELGRAAEAAPAILKTIQRQIRAGDTQEAASQWIELTEKVPGIATDTAVLLRLAQILVEQGDRERAASAIRQALLAAGARPGAALALKIAGLAVELDPTVALGAARLALAQHDLDPDARERAEQLTARLGQEPSGAPLSESALPLEIS